MKILIFTIMVFSLFSCNKTKESMQDVVKGAMEEAIESKTGNHVDLADSEDFENNVGFVSYKSAVKTYLTGEEKMTAGVIFQKENNGLSISFQFTSNDGTSFITVINRIPENFTLPLEGKFAVSNSYDGVNPVAVVMYMKVTENGMFASEIPYEGYMQITKLSKDTIEFEIDGKGSDANDADSPSNWKAISGKGKITSPIIQSFGIDKNNVLK